MDPWSKGDYSQLIREASMVVEKLLVVVVPSGRVPGRVLLVLPILEARRRRNRDEITKRVPSSRVSGRGVNICQRGASAETWGAQAPPRRGQEGGRAPCAPGALVAPLWPYFGRTEASGALIFLIYFPEFLGHF